MMLLPALTSAGLCRASSCMHVCFYFPTFSSGRGGIKPNRSTYITRWRKEGAEEKRLEPSFPPSPSPAPAPGTAPASPQSQPQPHPSPSCTPAPAPAPASPQPQPANGRYSEEAASQPSWVQLGQGWKETQSTLGLISEGCYFTPASQIM